MGGDEIGLTKSRKDSLEAIPKARPEAWGLILREELQKIAWGKEETLRKCSVTKNAGTKKNQYGGHRMNTESP